MDHFLAASGASTSDSSEQDSRHSGKSKLIPIAKPSLPSTFQRRRAIPTCESAESTTSPALMLSPAASLANPFPLLGSAAAQQMTAISGRKCSELYRLSGRHGSSLRTCTASLLLNPAWSSSQYFLIWRAKATAAKRLLFQLVPLMPPIDEIASGLWHTPTA